MVQTVGPVLVQAPERVTASGLAPERGAGVSIESPCWAPVATARWLSGWGLDMSSLSEFGEAAHQRLDVFFLSAWQGKRPLPIGRVSPYPPTLSYTRT